MNTLETNVIALPASTRSIKWCQYECSYSIKDPASNPQILSTCRQLLDAKVPCIWRPIGERSTLSALFRVSADKLAKPNGSKSDEESPDSAVPDAWHVWLFHAALPEKAALELVSLPPSFRAIRSGSIGWDSASLNSAEADEVLEFPPTQSTTSSQHQTPRQHDIHLLFCQALNNLIDCALLPLSVVRFGYGQWITLVDSPLLELRKNMGCSEQSMHCGSWELPLTPPNSESDIAPGAAEFLVANDNYEQNKGTHTMKTTDPHEHTQELSGKYGVCSTPTLYILKIAASITSRGLLLQQSARPASSLEPISNNNGAALSGLLQGRASKPAGSDGKLDALQPIASVRLAPYGIAAKIVSIPSAHLGDTEVKALESWSCAFGYSKNLLGSQAGIQNEAYSPTMESNLVWVVLPTETTPMLYPRRLVFIDKDNPLEAQSDDVQNKPVPNSSSQDTSQSTAQQAASQADITHTRAIKVGIDEEEEEGEDKGAAALVEREHEEGEEDDDDEEGEIADPIVVEARPNDKAVASIESELDTILAELRTENARSFEKSLAEIQEAMAMFTSELRLEEAEHKKKEKLQREAAAATSMSQNGKGTAVNPGQDSGKSSVSGSKKRQRSKSRDEGSKRARKKSISASNDTAATAGPSQPTATAQQAAANNASGTAMSSPEVLLADQAPLADSKSAMGVISTADIDSLFGDTTMGDGAAALVDGVGVGASIGVEGDAGAGADTAAAQGGMDLVFGQMGDDMGIGIGMGMGMDMDMDMDMDLDMGDMSGGMFGVTDDDFSFFDSVSSQPANIETAPASAQQSKQQQQPVPADPLNMDAVAIATKAATMSSAADLNTSMQSHLGTNSAENIAADAVDTKVPLDQPAVDSTDDFFDDGMFDSFFGGPPSATSAPSGGGIDSSLAVKIEPQTEITSMPTSDALPVAPAADLGIANGGMVETKPDAALLSSPQALASVSSAETHIGAVPNSTSTVVSGVDLNTPTSIKVTPLPSGDLQSPAHTPHTAIASKNTESIDGHQQHRMLAETPEVAVTARPQPSVHVVAGNSTLVVRPVPKPTNLLPVVSKASMTPQPYSFVNTPYDDIETSARSWLQDRPSPAKISGDASDLHPQELEPHNIRFASIMEHSLNPVSWIKRISARRMHQRPGMSKRHVSKVQKTGGISKPSYNSVIRARYAGSATPPSVHRLRGWLISYKAKSSYSQDFVPRYISSSNAQQQPSITEADSIADSCAESKGMINDRTMPASAIELQQQQHGNIDIDASTALADKAEGIKREGFAGSISQLQPRQVFRSFTSIINPRQPLSGHAQVPGGLVPSLDVAGLLSAEALYKPQHGTGQSCATDAGNGPGNGPGTGLVIKSTCIDSSWVPWWMLTAFGVTEFLIDYSTPVAIRCAFSWTAAIDHAAHLVMHSSPASSSRLARFLDAEIPVAHMRSAPGIRSGTTKAQTSNGAYAMAASTLSTRLGGLLMMGNKHSEADPAAAASNAGGQLCATDLDKRQALTASSKWFGQLRNSEGWAEMMEMLADWAVYGSLLMYAHSQDVATTETESEAEADKRSSLALSRASECATPLVASALSSALVSFWHSATDAKTQNELGGDSTEYKGLLPLGKLLSLDNNATPSPVTKYRGYVVKKRRVPSSSSGAGSGCGTVAVPSGPGTVEPLLDARIVVGAHGQQDVAIPSESGNGSWNLTSREAESIYIKRWRYEQKLASRARHEAKIASGEIEEAEEGEEREDGEDGAMAGTAEDQSEVAEDWPDPDSYEMEAEDLLRRACITVHPISLRWWSQLHMRPIGASKDIRWCAFIPPYRSSASSQPSSTRCDTQAKTRGDGLTAVDKEDGEVSEVARDWCKISSSAAESYLSDVDTAYHASHFGTHQPLGLSKVLDGVFTQLSVDNTTVPLTAGSRQASSASPPAHWSARLRYEAERLGRSMAHGWYTSSQLEQRRQQMFQEELQNSNSTKRNFASSREFSAISSTATGAVGAGNSCPLAATTLVVYMFVPLAHMPELWLAMAEASHIVVRAFEHALSSLIARTSHGVPSSTTTISSQVPWSSVIVHPLPLDQIVEWHHGCRNVHVPAVQETAMAVYNRSPEFLQPPPPPATNAAGSEQTMLAQRNNSSKSESIQHQMTTSTTTEFLALSATIAAVGVGRAGKSLPSKTVAAAAAGQLLRRSSYFAYAPVTADHLGTAHHHHGTAAVLSNGVSSNSPAAKAVSARGHLGFAHRAFAISSPCTFPTPCSALVAATMPISLAGQRNDIVLDDIMQSKLAVLGRASNNSASAGTEHAQSSPSMSPSASASHNISSVRSSLYPLPRPLSATTTTTTTTASAAAPAATSAVASEGAAATANNAGSNSAFLSSSNRTGDVTGDFNEARVCFGLAQKMRQEQQQATGTPATISQQQQQQQQQQQKPEAPIADVTLYSKLTSHPLRSSDHKSTLHCVYTVVKRNTNSSSSSSTNAWICVCWCDERGEYVEHEAFSDTLQPATLAMSPAAVARIWGGCIRYQALFGGQLRVVLGEWQGMAPVHAVAFSDFALEWNALYQPPVCLHLVNIGVSPPDGLCISAKGAGMPKSAAQAGNAGEHSGCMPVVSEVDQRQITQCTLVLHGQQPYLRFIQPAAGAETTLDEALACKQDVPTGYIFMQNPTDGASSVPCLCVQLLAPLASPSPSAACITAHHGLQGSGAGLSSDADSMLVVRSILKQYHQLAWLRHAESGMACSSDIRGWPRHFLPLPVAIAEDIRNGLELFLR